MRRVAALVALAGAVAAAPAGAQRSLAIERFDATIRVERGGAIQVAESITARFTGSWNGIYRKIPVTYRTAQGLNWTLGVEILGATDADGRALRVETGRERHYLKVQIWVPGAHDATRTVVLRYRATNALRFFDEHDELYWNVTGDEWDVALGAATARIELPAAATGLRAVAFNGVYGATAQEAAVETSGTTVRIVMPHALGFREGLTAVVGWDKGLVAEPAATARAVGIIASNWPLVIPVPVFFIAFAVWRRRGRDPARRPISVQYEPPSGLTPAEAGTLLDNQADLRDITATLVDLAVHGHLRFEEQDNRKLFGLIGKRDYRLERLDPPADAGALAAHEQRVLDGIFDGRGRSVMLSQLEDEFYSALPGIRTSIFDRLLERGFYHARPDTVRAHWVIGALVVGGAIAVGGSAIASRFLMTPAPFIIAGVLVALIVGAFAMVMPARTEAGARALEHVLGFLEFQRRVDAEHLKRIIVGHPEYFDRYLPFAMAFGVEKKWARAFEGIYTQPPRWYVGASVADFSVSRLSASLADFTSAAGSTLSSSPRSSSGSGFGGGGSSGGGGGGGGGGGF
jgi:hypothetical protein